jgi:hypothetical protein
MRENFHMKKGSSGRADMFGLDCSPLKPCIWAWFKVERFIGSKLKKDCGTNPEPDVYLLTQFRSLQP